VRTAVEAAGETAVDVGVYGDKLESALLRNTVASAAGQAIGDMIGTGWRAVRRGSRQ